ncbi:FAD-dependent oxidoreductase [Sphingobacterium sp. DK4209]|uniref:FAD-dependent oxidoreductase n=1 Tax=Sphingobacterium zhuxiongii TaxID=2662364 RepID=A0A5Q0QC59_9SPHI|nr:MULTISPECIES: FAD-dependent oxidoreductase [unclassified Sphingobacterium]MVZ67065.1 FAD-dependent oxidoreductase [Sphingobacterium sp. DK4209]QGA26864.1 FAD-dependent oxidoreductase [Sphingobacterium sp. dk4302]
MKKVFKVFIFCCLSVSVAFGQKKVEVDLCIYGATSAGVVAAYTAAKAGKKVVIVDPVNHIGGLSSGGLGMTDIGNKFVVTGLALDFYRKIGKHYGTFEQWIFEPKVAEQIFRDYLGKTNVQLLLNHPLVKVNKKGNSITDIELSSTEGKSSVTAKVFMDCTYEGDLLAASGVSYHVGREDNSLYGETINGVQLLEGHQFPNGVDPYQVKGDPSSGLLWGISNEKLLPRGTGDKKVQAYNYRITLTNVPENRIPITKPDNYDAKRYELLKRQKELQPWKSIQDVFIWSLMPNGKTDINNRNGFSTDMIGMNWDYPEADWKRRREIIKAHEDYTKGLLYFVGNDPAVPQQIRDDIQNWGYPKDEFVQNNHWTPQLYIREARRMVGEVVMTQNHCQAKEIVQDDIGYAAYTMDSHNCDRLVVDGVVKNEGNVEVGGFLPFPISYRSITPKRAEADNLLVPVCLSSSHIAFGSIRMEPVFMVLAQSAAVAAGIAIDKNLPVQDVKIADIKQVLASNPKADKRASDELIHVSNTKQVTLQGDWADGKGRGFGMSFKESTGNTASTARFTASKPLKAGKYKVYTYFPKKAESASKHNLAIFNGKSVENKVLDYSKVEIKGQTSSTWVEVGEFTFYQGKSNPYVEITNKGAQGVVAANAILFVPQTDQI